RPERRCKLRAQPGLSGFNVNAGILHRPHPEAKDLRDMVGPMEDARIHIEAGEAGLRAEFATPFGPRVLS
ncbi:MAG: hypothetical protein AAFZ04_14270, partial [Pseudomonadota bacterium]